MKKHLVIVLALVFGLVFLGCAKKTVVQPEQQATTQKAVEAEKQPEPAKVEEPVIAKEEPKKVEAAPIVEAKPVVPTFENIHFDFDKYNIRDDAKPALKKASDWLVENKSAAMLIEGHCDDRGTNEYNLALGERRAKSTRDYLASSGVEKKRLSIVSYGEERPLCKEKNEDCWQRNRRSQFILK